MTETAVPSLVRDLSRTPAGVGPHRGPGASEQRGIHCGSM